MNQSDEIALLRSELVALRAEIAELRRFQAWLSGGLAVLGGIGVLLSKKFMKVMGLG